MPHHVIIGGGPAGLNAIETVRQFDADSKITLISTEPTYSRMALPYFLAKQIPQAQLATGSDKYFEKLRVARRIGARVARVDGKGRTVQLADSDTLSFDTLLVATGSTPLRLPIPGADGPHVHTLWTLQDALGLLASAKGTRPSAVMVGAGFIGLIVLNALHKLGWKLTVVENEGRILPRMLDRRGADAAEAWLREHGVSVYTGCGVRTIEGERKKALHLSDGQTVRADMVILSTGIRPNVEFLKGSGVRVDSGVVIDAHARTNVAGIYAAGDVAQGPDLLGGPPAVHAVQPTAVDHGRIAGANMADQPRVYAGSLRINILDLAGLHCTSFGRWQETADVTTVWNATRPVYRKLVWEGSRLVGGIILGPVEDSTMLTDVGMLKGLIQARADLGEWKRYLNERPWDLRRAYVASGVATQLLAHTTVGAPSTARGYQFKNLRPPAKAGQHHATLVKTKPRKFDQLPRTPTPGIYKAPVAPKES